MASQDDRKRVYVLVAIQSGKEKEFCDEVLSKGLILDSSARMAIAHAFGCDWL